MRMSVYVAHILAGSLSLIFGFIALYSAKGAKLHRRSGMVFVCTMLAMCFAGFSLAVGNPWQEVNMSAATITAYLVVTSLATVRPAAASSRGLTLGAMAVAITVAVVDLTFGVQAVANRGKTASGIPAFPFFMFGVVGVLGTVGDLRVLRSGALAGASRVARHLWRMSFALFIATMSFFIGQMKVIPKPIRIPGLLALPVLAVLVTMIYWMWRVRIRRSLRGMIGVGTPKAA